ncbi:MAG TPA: ATP-binding protein, partial [Candidatus Ozemobacteraceae bacterium]|nr:ATP-binding protein [Candidatus Ozemobacteraceae bacterium]
MTPERERSTRSIRLRFRNPRYDRIVRLNTESIARRMGFNEDQVFDITLAVEEAYTNAIEHSRRSFDSLELEIIYHLFQDRLVVSIQDSGCGFEQGEPGIDQPLPVADQIRGRGLGLILNLSDHAEILSEPGLGTMIRITKFLAGAPGSRVGDVPRIPTCPGSPEARSSLDDNKQPDEV